MFKLFNLLTVIILFVIVDCQLLPECLSTGWNELFETDNIIRKAYGGYGVLNDKLYTFNGDHGGDNEFGFFTNSSTYFDPTLNKFNSTQGLNDQAEGCGAYLNNSLYYFRSYLYYYRYDKLNDEWIKIPYEIPFNSGQGCCATTLKDKIYICGGINLNCRVFDGTTFSELPGIFSGGSRPFMCSLVAFNNTLFSIGGDSFYDRTISNISYYDTNTSNWKNCGNLPYTVAAGSAVVYNNLIYYIGGYSYFTVISNVSIIDLRDLNNVVVTSGPQFPVNISGHSAAVFGDRIYVVYGSSDLPNYMVGPKNNSYIESYQYCTRIDTTGTTGDSTTGETGSALTTGEDECARNRKMKLQNKKKKKIEKKRLKKKKKKF